jgi:hypothetical protein
MTTAEDYESIANWVYKVDPLVQRPPGRAGQTFYTDSDSSSGIGDDIPVPSPGFVGGPLIANYSDGTSEVFE